MYIQPHQQRQQRLHDVTKKYRAVREKNEEKKKERKKERRLLKQ